MSCSKTSTVTYMVEHMLVKPNMELYTPMPTTRLIDRIEKLTNLAKSKYGVDMGPLFAIRARDVSIGNFNVVGYASIATKIRLEPNDAAFAAIDKSKTQEENALKEKLRVQKEVEDIQSEGNYVITSEGDIVPPNLPRINIKC